MEFDEEENYDIFTAEIPTRHQNIPEVIAAKQVEYKNYVKLRAFCQTPARRANILVRHNPTAQYSYRKNR